VAVLLVLDAVALVRLLAARPPEFHRGGAFGGGHQESLPSELPDGPATTSTPTTGRVDPAPTSVVAAAAPSRAPRPTTPPSTPSREQARLRPPALGVYTYDVDGVESASLFGSRRLGPTMTLVAHRDPGAAPDQVVLDQEFSREHEEREIARYGPDGVAVTFEGGSITFGGFTGTSEVGYEPPMTTVPFPLTPGALRSGASVGREKDGSVARVEEWRTSVLRWEKVALGVEVVDTAVVRFERHTRDGVSERVDQTVTYWFDPVRGLAVRWQDDVRGERREGLITLRYDGRYEAVLRSFRPS
jgi:hypothetical protein